MPSDVTLHIYHVGRSSHVGLVNEYLEAIGTGAFHGAVEVYGREYSYGSQVLGTGVFDCYPQQCTTHRYWKSVPMGTTALSKAEVRLLLLRLKREWLGRHYDVLRRNCCTFCDEFCQELGVGPVPDWVTNLAATGAALSDGAMSAAASAGQYTATKVGTLPRAYSWSSAGDMQELGCDSPRGTHADLSSLPGLCCCSSWCTRRSAPAVTFTAEPSARKPVLVGKEGRSCSDVLHSCFFRGREYEDPMEAQAP
mmetsp:Transcript_40574/g.128906  ORF Transcript_40574/g.128906 Transcript_40574/m.128906 type:complete len:252 (-) Transcript_40574:107-862(-)